MWSSGSGGLRACVPSQRPCWARLRLRGGAGQRRVLDAGCGTGGNLLHLGSYGRGVGVDLSADATAYSRRRGLPVARASVAALPFAPQTFDLVTSFDVLYHAWVGDDRVAVGELARVLRPGGLLLLRLPALELLRGAHDEAVQTRHRYQRDEVKALLHGTGLDVARISYCNTLLLPLILVRRTIDRLTGRHGSDVALLPPLFEWLFRNLLLAEARLMRHVSLPIGASIVALARKPG